jgi:hypothetical protein
LKKTRHTTTSRVVSPNTDARSVSNLTNFIPLPARNR